MNQTNTSTTAPKYVFRGELYMVDFGEGEGMNVHQGRRPVVVISNDVGNRYSNIVNVCLLTTKEMKKQYPNHLKLTPNALNKLKQPSTVMTEQIRTIGKERLWFKIGKLTDEEIHQLNQTIHLTLGLD